MNMKKLAPVYSFAQLKAKAQKDERYKQLAIVAAKNLGGDVEEDLSAALKWLETCIADSDEDEVIEEVNFCLDLV
jgi:hypothetical protein